MNYLLVAAYDVGPEASATVDIICESCHKLIYRKEYRIGW